MNEDRDKMVYKLAKEYFEEHLKCERCNTVIPPPPEPKKTLNEIYKRLLFSLKNRNMMNRYIADDTLNRMNVILNDFDPKKVFLTYPQSSPDWERLLDEIIESGLINEDVPRKENSLWPIFCKGAIDGAVFLSVYSDADHFNECVENNTKDENAIIEFPKIIKKEIRGIGYALACDFLKEIGFKKYAKPDVHIKDMFIALGLASEDDRDETMLRAILRVAKHNDEDPFTVDKYFWIIGNKGRKEDFINMAREKLGMIPTIPANTEIQ